MLGRRAFLAGAALALAQGKALAATSAPLPKAEQVGDGLWVVRGADEPIAWGNGGAIANSVILDAPAGAVLIDPGPSRLYGQALGRLAQRLCSKKVGMVLITHLHPDHAMGACAFDPAIVHALPQTRKDIGEQGSDFADALYRILAGAMQGTTVLTPQGDLAAGPLDAMGRGLQLYALNGHSAGDLVVLDEQTQALITGDLVFHNRAPATPHARIDQWQDSLSKLEAIPHRLLIPGHGPLDTGGEALAQTRDWLGWVQDSLQRAVDSGLDMVEAGALPIPDRFAPLRQARYEWQRSVAHFYAGLETQALPIL
ncbi:quinoprotein relay system zinc metallohydrolase 1 [Novosphingobium umbonatum]|uniref:Quinoprotein relay system zinc metallohydrolase 1 n=1 Tax=Novosphingobium umbonatum TaxID=1908524 RepID=A0A3S2VFY3_9SPHN|nr:quinoprotein relay system zinc metallohydrolase 1 [Novosphingobium umbonatum]